MNEWNEMFYYERKQKPGEWKINAGNQNGWGCRMYTHRIMIPVANNNIYTHTHPAHYHRHYFRNNRITLINAGKYR